MAVGFQGYDDEGLEAVVAHWARTPTTPGSLGDRAKRDALAELERRRAARAGDAT